jgi:hypothetical protein
MNSIIARLLSIHLGKSYFSDGLPGFHKTAGTLFFCY